MSAPATTTIEFDSDLLRRLRERAPGKSAREALESVARIQLGFDTIRRVQERNAAGGVDDDEVMAEAVRAVRESRKERAARRAAGFTPLFAATMRSASGPPEAITCNDGASFATPDGCTDPENRGYRTRRLCDAYSAAGRAHETQHSGGWRTTSARPDLNYTFSTANSGDYSRQSAGLRRATIFLVTIIESMARRSPTAAG
jgi:hypothetical protein